MNTQPKTSSNWNLKKEITRKVCQEKILSFGQPNFTAVAAYKSFAQELNYQILNVVVYL